MKQFFFVILFVILMSDAFSQNSNTGFENRKKTGYFNTTQLGLLIGNRQINGQNTVSDEARTELFPSVLMTNGRMFNERWAAGFGVGFEIFDRNLFPVFADIRYTMWDNKISPFFAFKTGYAFCNLKKKHYDNLSLSHEPYWINDAYYRKDGGIMLYPEMGVKVPLSENADLMFTVAYRYQKIKSKVDYYWNYTEKYEENLNRLSFGVAIMFR